MASGWRVFTQAAGGLAFVSAMAGCAPDPGPAVHTGPALRGRIVETGPTIPASMVKVPPLKSPSEFVFISTAPADGSGR